MKNLLLLLALLAASAALAQTPPAPLIADAPARQTLSLNGVWRAIPDPYDAGGYYRMNENRPPQNNELREYNYSGAPLLQVPGDWNTQQDRLFFYEGAMWCERSFTAQAAPGRRRFLHFGGAANRATVYLNGKKIGEHEGAYTAFDLEVTDKLLDGANELIVRVDNRRSVTAVPALNTDWWNYGGLTRDVSLLDAPSDFIRDYSVRLAKGSLTKLEGWAQLDGAAAGEKVTLAIPEANLELTSVVDEHGRAYFSHEARFHLWSPEDPHLYAVKLRSAHDEISDEIGLRSIETRGAKIYLNGREIFLRGVSIHEEAPYRGGRAVGLDDDRTLLGWARELGCNFVRLAHYPHNEQMTRLADHMGLLVWSEIPVYWDTAWSNPATLANAQEQLRDEIARDHNRASIIIWSIANETPDSAERTEFLRKLIAQARAQDGSRLISAALNRVHRESDGVRVLDDPLGQELDVVGLNEYVGWYEDTLAGVDHMRWRLAYDKPLIVSEFGGGAQAGRHSESAERWSEEYQNDLYRRQLKALPQIPQLAGMSPWVLMDFYSPRRMNFGVQDWRNRKGLLSDRGLRKQAFYTLQEFYRAKAAEEKK